MHRGGAAPPPPSLEPSQEAHPLPEPSSPAPLWQTELRSPPTPYLWPRPPLPGRLFSTLTLKTLASSHP